MLNYLRTHNNRIMKVSSNFYYLQKFCMEKQGISCLRVVITLFMQVTQLVQIPEMTKETLHVRTNHLCWGLQELNSTFNWTSYLHFLFTVFTIHNASNTLGAESTKKNQQEEYTIIFLREFRVLPFQDEKKAGTGRQNCTSRVSHSF